MKEKIEKESPEQQETRVSKTIRMPANIVKKIEILCEQNNRSFSNQVITILTKYFELTKDN